MRTTVVRGILFPIYVYVFHLFDYEKGKKRHTETGTELLFTIYKIHFVSYAPYTHTLKVICFRYPHFACNPSHEVRC